ncbi:MAG TPA: hypothetical protein VJU79_09420 [Candidatus Dormibacteraeota bacterium]|nr:hypothetical protein [Candidatus Dormibacteraeota bacterium]
MSNNIGLIIAVGAFLLVGAYLMVNQGSLDLAGPLRNWLWARDARRMHETGRRPDTIERSYWTAAEYERDSPRLEALGYIVASRSESEPYVSGPPDPRTLRPPSRRRVPILYIVYELDPRSAGQPRGGDQTADVEHDRQHHEDTAEPRENAQRE